MWSQFIGFITLFIFFPENHSLHSEFISIALHEHSCYTLNHTYVIFPSNIHTCIHINSCLRALAQAFSSFIPLSSFTHSHFSYFPMISSSQISLDILVSSSLIPFRATPTISTCLYNILYLWLSTYDSWTNSIRVSWKFVKNAHCQALSQVYGIRNPGGRAHQSMFSKVLQVILMQVKLENYCPISFPTKSCEYFLPSRKSVSTHTPMCCNSFVNFKVACTVLRL